MDAPVDKPTEIHRSQQAAAPPAAAGQKPKLGRLSVNITPATQAAIDQVVEREGVTVTEALRRLVGYGRIIYEADQINGDHVLIRRGDVVERIVVI